MLKVQITTKIRNSPVVVYRILRDMHRFPEFMPDAKMVAVIKKMSDNNIITKWEADIDGTSLEWVEQDFFDTSNWKIKFCMIEGAFKKYEGMWSLTPTKNGTSISLSINLDWGIPNFEKYVASILEEKTCRSMRGMIWLVRKRANKWTDSDL